jgi:hypothetical protein
VTVDAVALDEFFPRVEETVRLVKIDIQGAERAALLGMRGLLARSPGVHVFMELWPFVHDRFGGGAAELLALLESWGFEIWRVGRHGLPVERLGAGAPIPGRRRSGRLFRRPLHASRGACERRRGMLTRTPSRVWLADHRRIWQRKASLRRVYGGWFRTLREACAPGAPVVEVGCGPGLFKERYPEIVATDVEANSGSRRTPVAPTPEATAPGIRQSEPA